MGWISKRCLCRLHRSRNIKRLFCKAAASKEGHFNMARATLLVLVGILAALSSSTIFLKTVALDENYYAQLGSNHFCLQAPAISSKTVLKYVLEDKNKAAQLLRLHFHDCFVRGCDASVLIKKANGQAERDSPPNANSIGGFEVIDDIKAQLEQQCARTVSCADILALAARDAVFWLSGVFWDVPLGRKDGNVSDFLEPLFNLPPPNATNAQLISIFASKNLNAQQMVVLSGAHTIGTANCVVDETRLYDFNGTGRPDPSMDPDFVKSVKKECPSGIQNKRVAMKDFISFPKSLFSSNNTFDNVYYQNVKENKGFFESDANLLKSSVTKQFVDLYDNNQLKFYQDFGDAMIAMGKIGVMETGYVRKTCSVAFS